MDLFPTFPNLSALLKMTSPAAAPNTAPALRESQAALPPGSVPTPSGQTALTMSSRTPAYVDVPGYGKVWDYGTSSENTLKYGQDEAFAIRSAIAGVSVQSAPVMTPTGAALSYFTTQTSIGGYLADIGQDIQNSGLSIASGVADKITSAMTGEKTVLPPDTGFFGSLWKWGIWIGLAALALIVLIKIL